MHRGMRVINLIVVHCSATKADRDFTEQDLEVCHRRRGMNGPGYHFYIRKNGDIKTTRPIEKIGAHARGYNAQSIGICYEGGVSERGRPADTRTVWQKHSLRVLVRALLVAMHQFTASEGCMFWCGALAPLMDTAAVLNVAVPGAA